MTGSMLAALIACAWCNLACAQSAPATTQPPRASAETNSTEPVRNPPVAELYDDERMPAGPAHRRRQIGFLIAGAAVFGAGYLGSVVTYAANTPLFDVTLLLPVVGPWLSSQKLDRQQLTLTDGERATDKAVLVLQGLLQTTGAILGVLGFIRYSSSDSPARTTSEIPAVRFACLPIRTGAIVSVQGVF